MRKMIGIEPSRRSALACLRYEKSHQLAQRRVMKARPIRKPRGRRLVQFIFDATHKRWLQCKQDNLEAVVLTYSRSHFLRMFETATGLTPHRYLLQLRLERAQELMRKGSTSLIDIAALCGFSSHAHMSRVFRQLLGVTPSQYRRNL